MRICRSILWLLLCLAVVSGCGYHFSGQANPFSGDIRTIAIPVFGNQTTETGFENYVTNQLVYQFSSRKKLQVVGLQEADAVLRGKVLSVDLQDVTFTGSYYGIQRKVVITLKAALETRDGRVLWQDENIRKEENYRIDANPLATEDEKQKALRKIAAELAEMVYVRMFEDF